MLVVMQNIANRRQVDDVVRAVEKIGLKAQKFPRAQRIAIDIIGNPSLVDHDSIVNFPGVQEVIHLAKKYKLASREYHPDNTLVRINNEVVFGGADRVIIAGPCAIESREQLQKIAREVKSLGAHMLRGGAYKPRTSPYSFQGIGKEALKTMHDVGKEIGLPIVSEIVSIADLDLFQEYVDMIQIGSRNMYNFDLLQRVAVIGKPILLKRGMSATMEEFLLAAEYILNKGNSNIVLCERGIRTFETSTRNILDLNTLTLIQKESHLPIIADPSHSAGRHDLVLPLAKAALAAGSHGLIVEVHDNPKEAMSDGEQSLNFKTFKSLMQKL